MNSFRPFFLAVLLLSVPALAQERAQDYVRAAGTGLPLYRARVADVYGNRFNGTYLIDNEGFLPGDLCYEGKVYPGILLNLDAVLHHVLVQQEGSPIMLDVGQDRIAWFTRGGRRYVNLTGRGYKLPDGFYEVVEEGRGGLYRRIDKALLRLPDPSSSARNYIGYDDPKYIEGLLDYYNWKESWYQVREDGSVKRLRSKRSIEKAVQYVRTQAAH